MVVEVLSNSTELYDRSEKFLFYKSLPSFSEYLLVAQREQLVERHARLSRGGWRSESYGPGNTLTLKSINCTLAVDEIYRGIEISGDQSEGA